MLEKKVVPWTKHDKAHIGSGHILRDGSGEYVCPICWGINSGWEHKYRVPLHAPECPVCKTELEWEDNG